MTVTVPPTPRRMTRPKWLDVRVIGGVLLLVASIAIGTKVIGGASRTSPVWTIAHDVAAGTVLVPADFVAQEVNLGDGGRRYLGTATDLSGRVLNRPLGAGELVPAAALGEVGDSRVLSVAVSADHLAPGIGHGSVVDLYLVTGRGNLVGGQLETRLIHPAVTIQSVLAPASGGLSGAVSSRYQVSLLLTPTDADALVRQLPLGEPVLVLHSGAVVPASGGG
ncbi:MAG: SAF domain-containing protein [Nakamurella sp.]